MNKWKWLRVIAFSLLAVGQCVALRYMYLNNQRMNRLIENRLSQQATQFPHAPVLGAK